MQGKMEFSDGAPVRGQRGKGYALFYNLFLTLWGNIYERVSIRMDVLSVGCAQLKSSSSRLAFSNWSQFDILSNIAYGGGWTAR